MRPAFNGYEGARLFDAQFSRQIDVRGGDDLGGSQYGRVQDGHRGVDRRLHLSQRAP